MRILPWLYLIGSRQFGLSSPWDCHIYALRSDQGILLIDAGSGLANPRIVANLKAEFGDPLPHGAILITHQHPDHAAGADSLSRQLGGWPVHSSTLTAPILTAGQSATPGYPAEVDYSPCDAVQPFEPAAQFDLQGFHIEAIPVQGHSEDSIAFLIDGQHLFSADIVFYGGLLGLINAPGSDLAAYRRDLPKLAGRNIRGLFPSHGLFTVENGQQHIDTALLELQRGFVPRAIGQGDLIF